MSGEGTPVTWKGADGGRWADPANWSSGKVPGSDNDVYVTGAANILVDAEIEPVHAIYLGDGSQAAMLTMSNLTSKLVAQDVVLDNKAVLTCVGPFTNENDRARVHVSCRTLRIKAGGKIDVTQKGWDGGLWWNNENNVGTSIHLEGYGPGGSLNGTCGSSHGGRGGSPYVTAGIRPTYGDAVHPETAGSGGAMPIRYGGRQPPKPSAYSIGWAGGGIVRIEATGDVVVDGEILADGAGCNNAGGNRDAASAGGSVWITCRSISGTGTVAARGGSGGDPRIPASYYHNSTSTDLNNAFPGGGGRIAIDYDPEAQKQAVTSGLAVSAAAGEYYSGYSTLATRDDCETAAENGTIHFTDETLVKQLFGKGLSGRVVGLSSLSFDGDVEYVRGFFSTMEEGFTLSVGGSLSVTGANARLEVGGVCLSNLASHATIWAGRSLNALTVGGDFTVSDGGSFVVRSAETNATLAWGGEVRVTGAMTVGDGGRVYAACDGRNCGAPRILPGSFTVEAGGVVSADRRGGLGEDRRSNVTSWLGHDNKGYGYGLGCGHYAAAASHGGRGGLAWNESATNGESGPICDNAWLPVLPGAGGGSDGYGDAGTGGGVIYVVTPGAIRVDGTISADGWCGAYFSQANMNHFGGGAGGTVFLCGDSFSGGSSAVIRAKGGDVLNGTSKSWCASGGGGRIAVWTGGSRFLAGKCHKNRHNESPVGYAGAFDVSGGGFLTPYGGSEMTDAVRTVVAGGEGTIRFGTFEEPRGVLLLVR